MHGQIKAKRPWTVSANNLHLKLNRLLKVSSRTYNWVTTGEPAKL